LSFTIEELRRLPVAEQRVEIVERKISGSGRWSSEG